MQHAFTSYTLSPPTLLSVPAAVLSAVADPLAEMCSRSSEALNPVAASRWVAGPVVATLTLVCISAACLGLARDGALACVRFGLAWMCALACRLHTHFAGWTRAATLTPPTSACSLSTAPVSNCSHTRWLPINACPAGWTRAATLAPPTSGCSWSTASPHWRLGSTLLPRLCTRRVDEGSHLSPTVQRVLTVKLLPFQTAATCIACSSLPAPQGGRGQPP